LKYERQFPVLPYLGALLYRAFELHIAPTTIDFIIPVPLHVHKLRQRGFNQALLLGRRLSRQTGISLLPRTLRKTRDTPTQTALTGTERRHNLKGAFSVAGPHSLDDASVLLVDDVFTTGATLNECAGVLTAHGAAHVLALTVARSV
jgi:ComF family protein